MPFEASHEEKNTESCVAESDICLIFVALAVIITANVTNKQKRLFLLWILRSRYVSLFRFRYSSALFYSFPTFCFKYY